MLLLPAALRSSAADHTDAHQHHDQKATPAAERLKTLTGKQFEVSFLTNMIHHHRMAIQMSKLAHGRASGPLHDLSHEMMDKQEAEIEQMTRWLQEWHSLKPGEMNHDDPCMKKSMATLEKLKQLKGPEFDQLFIQEMTRHHNEGTQLANLATSKAEHAELRPFAKKMAEDQQKDNQKLTSLKKT